MSPLKTRIKIERIPFWISLLAVFGIIFDFGFDQIPVVQKALHWVYVATIAAGTISIPLRFFRPHDYPNRAVWPFDAVLLLLLVALLPNIFGWMSYPFLESYYWIYVASFLVFIREFFALNMNLNQKYLNPAQLFILSFIMIIFVGTILLLLPGATHDGISVIDALFTSTSAVCVTGLIVVDTGSYFTNFGQSVILLLIQSGGLGIMTFTSYFSFFFRGSSSYESQLMLKDMTNTEKIADVFSTLKKIILLTFSIEAIGGIFIYTSLDKDLIVSTNERLFFSVFHSVSGFCNAGFSTLSNSLYETGFRFNYPLHLTIAFLFIIGGIGFPILFNFYKYLKHLVINRLFAGGNGERPVYAPWIINLNTRIVLITTLILIITGTIAFFLFEYNNTLAEHNWFGKIVTAFFGAVTPRTAGFNTIDTSALHFSTIMIILLLMWIGASPASTGGGIKTSSFAIGTLNYLSIAKGKKRIELFGREIADISVRRAFAIISLSLVVVGGAAFLVSSFESDKDLLPIAFECFSAYSTVGLSLGITDDLGSASKLVIIFTMFIGRVSMLTILIALVRKAKHFKYHYPTEEILIN